MDARDDEAARRRTELKARLRDKIGAKREGRTGGSSAGGVSEEVRGRRDMENMVMSAVGDNPELMAFAQQALRDPRRAKEAFTSKVGPDALRGLPPAPALGAEDDDEEEAPPPTFVHDGAGN